MHEWYQRILKRLKRGQKCPHRLILIFPRKVRKEEPDVPKLADAAICEDALEAFRLLCQKNWGILTATDPVDWHGCSLPLVVLTFSLSCPGGHEDWISILKCLSLLNYVHDTFRFFYKFCRVQGSLSSVLLGTECMNGTKEY